MAQTVDPLNSSPVPSCTYPSSPISSTYPELNANDILKYYDYEITETDPDVRRAIVTNKTRMCELRIKQINKIRNDLYQRWEGAEPIHLYIAFMKKNMDPDELYLALSDSEFRDSVDEEVKARRRAMSASTSRAKNAAQRRIEEKFCTPKKKKQQEEAEEEEDETDEEFVVERYVAKKEKRVQPKGKQERVISKVKGARKPQVSTLKCPEGISKEEWETWSDAKKFSYVNMGSNPNTYLYRNLPPGEKQKNGAWSKQETDLFMKRLQEMREQGIAEGKWGIFSMKIPGRVGYQCANFYRKLLQAGKIQDNFYRKDENGNLHFKDRKHKSRDGSEDEDVAEGSDEENVPLYERWAAKNPLPGKNDFITGAPIRVPAISVYGSVLDYNTWLNLLKDPKTQVDPFTQQHFNKRQITVLTTDNFEQFKDEIKHM